MGGGSKAHSAERVSGGEIFVGLKPKVSGLALGLGA